MSRIGQAPVSVPSGVNVTIDGADIIAKGSKGELRFTSSSHVSVKQEGDTIVVTPSSTSKEGKLVLFTTISKQKGAFLKKGIMTSSSSSIEQTA